MRVIYPTLLALSCLAMSAPAIAVTNGALDIRIADDQVAREANLARQAVQQGDPAAIAVARARLQAAQAVAWGRRHPAKPPVERTAVQ